MPLNRRMVRINELLALKEDFVPEYPSEEESWEEEPWLPPGPSDQEPFPPPEEEEIVFPEESFIFSESETLIGRWIDGKPLYRRVFPFTAVADALHYPYNYCLISFEGMGMDTICRAYGNSKFLSTVQTALTSAYLTNYGGFVFYPRAVGSNPPGCYISDINKANPTVGVIDAPQESGEIIVEYTKLADRAIYVNEGNMFSTTPVYMGEFAGYPYHCVVVPIPSVTLSFTNPTNGTFAATSTGLVDLSDFSIYSLYELELYLRPERFKQNTESGGLIIVPECAQPMTVASGYGAVSDPGFLTAFINTSGVLMLTSIGRMGSFQNYSGRADGWVIMRFCSLGRAL